MASRALFRAAPAAVRHSLSLATAVPLASTVRCLLPRAALCVYRAYTVRPTDPRIPRPPTGDDRSPPPVPAPASVPDESNAPLDKVPAPEEIAENFPWNASRHFSTAYPDDGGIIDSVRLTLANNIGMRTFGLAVAPPSYWDSDFRAGALQAFKVVTDLVSRRDIEPMVPLLGPELLRRFRDSFLWMAKQGMTLSLKVNPESFTLPRVRRLRVVVGNPASIRGGAMHVDDFFGHKLYIDTAWLRADGGERVPANALSFRALRAGLKVQVEAACQCSEVFSIKTQDRVLVGSDEEVPATHRVTFEAFLSEESGITELEWRVADIDRVVNLIER